MWDALSVDEKAALRKLALGYVYDVPAKTRAQLAKLGLVDGGPECRLTKAGLELLRAHPNRRKPGAKGLIRFRSPHSGARTSASKKISAAAGQERAS